MKIQATVAATWQLKTAVKALQRQDEHLAERFVQEVGNLLSASRRIDAEGRVLEDLPETVFTEIRRSGYRLFFREAEGVLWLAGAWPEDSRR